MSEEKIGAYYEVTGGKSLKGSVSISGSKNASLPVLAASILCGDEVVMNNVPRLRDVAVMEEALSGLGASVKVEDNTTIVNTRDINTYETGYELLNKMRASIYVMGPLLARFGEAKVAMPGGCAIGTRPIDYHIAGFEKMGATITKDHGYIVAKCEKLKGARIYLDFPSVGATANLMMAAVLAEGTTIIENAAQEPHILDLEWFLKSIGGRVSGGGSSTVTITGVSKLHGATHQMIPDQIEAGTFMVAAALTQGNITIEDARITDLRPMIEKLLEAGVTIKEQKNSLKVSTKKKSKPVRITTMPHPGFPTDMQPQMMALMATADGVSFIKESVWENRFMHVPEMQRMGADIDIQGHVCVVTGVGQLNGAKVNAPDLRAGAALVLSGLAADKTTTVYNIFHIDRGYEEFDRKIRELGGEITRVEPPQD